MKRILDLATALQRLGEKASWLDQTTYVGWKAKARFVDPDFGEWWTLPKYVCDGHSHPRRGRFDCAQKTKWSLAEAKQKLGEKADWLVEETYNLWGEKALFRHPIHGDWWARPSTVAAGHEHPNDAAVNRMATSRGKYGKVVNYTPPPAENLVGKVFNNLTVLKPIPGRRYYWECLCVCGTVHIAKGTSLRSGKTSNCGCKSGDSSKQRARIFSSNFIGTKFNKWLVIGIDDSDTNKLLCQCDCGTIRAINRPSLVDGRSTNCGCIVVSYITESNCRKILEEKTGCLWPKQRIFRNPLTNRLLELDGYCAELSAAFEYDGEQHYKESWIDNDSNRLFYRQQLDVIKTNCCIKENIKLIRIPYTQKKNLEEYITQQLHELGIPVVSLDQKEEDNDN